MSHVTDNFLSRLCDLFPYSALFFLVSAFSVSNISHLFLFTLCPSTFVFLSAVFPLHLFSFFTPFPRSISLPFYIIFFPLCFSDIVVSASLSVAFCPWQSVSRKTVSTQKKSTLDNHGSPFGMEHIGGFPSMRRNLRLPQVLILRLSISFFQLFSRR